MTTKLQVEVVYALPERAWHVVVCVPSGACVAVALAEALPVLRRELPGLEVDSQCLAIFGRAVTPDTTLHEGDRIELLRPLLADPKQARRRRAQGKRVG